eukprot:5028066-Prymnesium_polylepis.1
MRSWWWVDRFRKHPERKFKIGKETVYALCLIAMLTCGPPVYRRICRQVMHAPAQQAHERMPQHAQSPWRYTVSAVSR